jgi:uncharacterized repeat protein (TIGR01451 family)
MHMSKTLKSALVLAGAFALLMPLCAQQMEQPGVKMVMSQSKIVVANGVEQKQSADKVKPGDVIEYVVECKNPGTKAVKDFKPVLPVPAALEYIPQSASPVPVMASTDGKNFAPVPLKRKVQGADGKMSEQLVPVSEYRSLQWDLGNIEGGASKSVKARMKVKAAS